MTVEHLASQRGTRLHGETIASIGNLIFASEGLQDKLMNKPLSDKQKILKGPERDLGPSSGVVGQALGKES